MYALLPLFYCRELCVDWLGSRCRTCSPVAMSRHMQTLENEPDPSSLSSSYRFPTCRFACTLAAHVTCCAKAMHSASSGFEAEATTAGESEMRRRIKFHTPGSDTER